MYKICNRFKIFKIISNNIYFNQVEGFDKIIDNQQTIFTVPVSSTTGWTKAVEVNATFTTDSGTTITTALGADPVGAFYYSSSANNVLESDRYIVGEPVLELILSLIPFKAGKNLE